MEDNYNELLLRCASQDTQAFNELYTAFSPRIYSLLLRILRQESIAEEVLQEAFLKVWDSAASYSPSKGKAFTWVATISRNKALDKLRSFKSRPQETEITYEGLEFVSEDNQPDDNTDQKQDIARLENCLDGLKDEQKECILQAYYYGYTHQELSVKMDKPLGTVKAWIRRGLETLRDCM